MTQKQGSRYVRSLAAAVATFALAAGAAQAQSPLPDPPKDGNSADQSIGTVQVGPVTVDPTPVVAIQVGGGNTAGGSTGSAQIQPTTAAAGAGADARGIAPNAQTEASISGQQALGDQLGVDLSSLGQLPGPATTLVLQILHEALPSLPAGTALDKLVEAGTLQVGQGGDDIFDPLVWREQTERK